jgi:hypothetical protein
MEQDICQARNRREARKCPDESTDNLDGRDQVRTITAKRVLTSLGSAIGSVVLLAFRWDEIAKPERGTGKGYWMA